MAARAIWQPDKWERLSFIADQVGTATSGVLDVGGRSKELARLLDPVPVISANIEGPADRIIPPDSLPFADRSFEVVTSCDVLEHMAAELRPSHVAELLRVAERRVILCFPPSSPEKEAAERRIAKELETDLGFRPDFLHDHLDFGLPEEADVRTMIRDANPEATISALYQGHFEGGEALLLDGMRARHHHDPKALGRYVRRVYFGRVRPALTPEPRGEVHRVFLTVELTMDRQIG